MHRLPWLPSRLSETWNSKFRVTDNAIQNVLNVVDLGHYSKATIRATKQSVALYHIQTFAFTRLYFHLPDFRSLFFP